MALDKILSVGGKPGLYKLLTQTRAGFVGESLIDGKRITVSLRSNVSVLSEIAIYTLTEEVPLRDVLKKIRDNEKGQQTEISHKAPKIELEEYFFGILPEYDEDRVYASDIKKIVQWYNLLQKHDMLDALETGNDDEAEVESHKDKASSEEE